MRPPLAEETVRIEAIADPLGPVHAALASLWATADRALHPPPDATWRGEFATAVAEIAANISRHAYADHADLAFEFRWRLHPGGVSAHFRDHGRSFRAALPSNLPASVPDDPTDQAPYALPEGGWGLALAQAALDELRYDRHGDENRWLLVKRFPA